MILGLDTETTGLDPWHGTLPYIVTTCSDSGDQVTWEWDVDPLTRKPLIPLSELEEIQDLLHCADRLVLQNSTYDLQVLEALNGYEGWKWKPWPWHKIHDTQISGHMLASAQSLSLTNQTLVYLGINVQPFEDRIKEATNKCRRIVRTKQFQLDNGEWAIAKVGRQDMPSATGECWKADMWLPRAIYKNCPEYLPSVIGWESPLSDLGGDDPDTHPWLNLTLDYAMTDSEITIALHKKQEIILKQMGLWGIYKERLKVLPVVYKIKSDGITANITRKNKLYIDYEKQATYLTESCVKIADNPELTELPVNGRSNSLNSVIFDQFKLVSPRKTKTGNPTMDKETLNHWLETLEKSDKRRLFIKNLRDYRQRKTAMAYMDGYERFWLETEQEGYYVLHPSLNPTGTNTLRWSSSNPNQQNISKKEGFNLRYCFGPVPGRCWASLDYENIELRIPAYESGEKELIELFERPDDPPYYGSVHLLNFSTVYPDMWDLAVKETSEDKAADYIKKNWKSTWYQRCKNGDFAVQYGSVDKEGEAWSTADRAFGRKGCQALLKSRFSKQEALNQYWIGQAKATGYVSTIPDVEVCPDKGYPLQCPKTNYGTISPTVPLNYHVQGTACWVIFRAMLKVQDYFNEINEGKPKELHWNIVMQVHDELVIDFPFRKGFQVRLRKVKEIMESCGDCINVPLRVGCDIHENNWSEGYGL